VLKIAAMPAGTTGRLTIYDLSGREVADFQLVQSGQSYSFIPSSKGIFLYRLTGTNFSKTGKFYF
jgi:hypothetical protein